MSRKATKSDALAAALSDREFLAIAEALEEPFPLSPTDEPRVSFFATFYYGYLVGKHGEGWEQAMLDVLGEGTD